MRRVSLERNSCRNAHETKRTKDEKEDLYSRSDGGGQECDLQQRSNLMSIVSNGWSQKFERWTAIHEFLTYAPILRSQGYIFQLISLQHIGVSFLPLVYLLV